MDISKLVHDMVIPPFEAESVMSLYPEIASVYLAATGDNNGVKTESGNTVLDCWQDLLGLLLCLWKDV